MAAVRQWSLDALGPLVVYVVILLGVPSELIVSPLGAAGTPAQIMGIGFAFWWLLSRLVLGAPTVRRFEPIKRLLLVFIVAMLLSYAVGAVAPRSAAEHSSADRWLLTLAAWAGVTLVVAEGLSTRRRLDTCLKVLCWGVVGIAVLGMVQFFFGVDIAHLFSIPGLSANHSFGALTERSSFRRVNGTTLHPIEFGVVLSCALPLLVHFAIHSGDGRRRTWWVGVALVGAALPMSVARTAIVGAAVAVGIAFWSWPRQVRRRALLLSPFAVLGMKAAVPGLLGTIKSLFLNAGSDPSTAGRTDDYGPVWHYFTMDPVTGRGVGTFIPGLYRTLDNQYLGMLVEGGILGLLALLALVGGGMAVALVLRNRTVVPVDRSLAAALSAGLAVPLVTFVTFDGLAFPMGAGILFLLLGATAALWRLDRPSRELAVTPSPQTRGWLSRAAVAALVTGLTLMPYGAWLLSQRTAYQATATALVQIPSPVGVNPYLKASRAERATGILRLVVDGPQVRERLRERVPSADYGIAVGNGSLERGTDVVKSASSLTMRVTAASPDQAAALRAALLDETALELKRIQAQVGVPTSVRLVIRLLDQPAVSLVRGSAVRVALALVIVWALISCSVGTFIRQRGRDTVAHHDARPPLECVALRTR